MDLNRIAVFSRVLMEGSFTKAALALGLPKSSVSRSVSMLEEELGTRLLQRSSRKVSATEAGLAYYERVSRGLASIEEANACAAEQHAVPTGIVRITAPYDASVDVFVPLLTAFVLRHPTIKIDLVLTGRIVDLVEEGFDLALRGGVVRDQSLIARKIAEMQLAAYASRAYLERRGEPGSVAELAKHDCVIFRGARGQATWTLLSGQRSLSVDVTGGISVDDVGAVRAAIVEGAGIGLLPPFACVKELQSGAVVRVLPEWTGPAGALNLVYPSARLVPQRVVVVREYLLEELARVRWTCTQHASTVTGDAKKTRDPKVKTPAVTSRARSDGKGQRGNARRS